MEQVQFASFSRRLIAPARDSVLQCQPTYPVIRMAAVQRERKLSRAIATAQIAVRRVVLNCQTQHMDVAVTDWLTHTLVNVILEVL